MNSRTIIRRNTVKKQLIIDTLTALGSHKTAREVYLGLQKTHPEIGRATVYRVLSAMADDGFLKKIDMAGGDSRYDITVAPHDHIICRVCGRVDDVWLDGGEKIKDHIVDASGYTVESERIEFVGLCRECGKKLKEAENG